MHENIYNGKGLHATIEAQLIFLEAKNMFCFGESCSKVRKVFGRHLLNKEKYANDEEVTRDAFEGAAVGLKGHQRTKM